MKTKLFSTGKIAGFALASSLCFTQAFAGGPLDLNPNDPDNFTRWANGGANIPFNPDQGGLGPQTNAQAVADTEAAFQAWEDIPTATTTYVNAGQMPFDIDVTNFAPFIDNLFNGNNNSDGFSPIAYDEDGSIFIALFGISGILGFATADTFDANGVPIEAVSFLNGGAILGGFPLSDFFGVQVHEYGHYSGLAHTVVNGQNIGLGDTSGPTPNNTFGNAPPDQVETMYPFAIQGGGEDTPHADDIAFLSTMYPAPGFFASTGSISGNIIAPNGTTPLTGVNVIARNVANPFVDAVSAISGDRGVPGEYTINGLTPGAEYVVFVDEILDGGFSTTPLVPLPGPEEFYNGASESNDPGIDDPNDSVTITAVAGTTQTGIDIIFNGVGPGSPLPVGDDGFVEVFMPFTFTLCGQDFESVFINANGNLTFGAPSTDFSESTAEHLSGPPRIAGVWDDVNPSAGGSVTFDDTVPGRFTVTWSGVPEFPATGANTFEIILFDRFRRGGDDDDDDDDNGGGSSLRDVLEEFGINLGDDDDDDDLFGGDDDDDDDDGFRIGNLFIVKINGLTLTDGLSGYSCGSFVTSTFETESDLSGQAPIVFRSLFNTAVFEQFTFGETNDLADTLLIYPGTKTFRDRFERNDSLNRARRIRLPFDSIDNRRRYTSIDPVGDDVDYYKFRADAGQTLVAEVIAGALDSTLGLFDASGTLIASDDDGGAGALSRIVFEIPADGRYFLAASAFPDTTNFDGSGGSGGRYVLDVQLIDGVLLSLGDDSSVEVDLGFTFPFQGQNWTSVFVNSNGNLTFGAGDTDFSESVAEFLAESPRIAALWDDLSPNQGGLVIAKVEAGSATITFQGVPQFLAGDSNNFAVTINSSGQVIVDYGDVAALDGIVGVTEGGGAADPGGTDLSAAASLSVSGTTYEQFAIGNDFDLSNSGLTFE
ncbi:MAG: pre-peptidase C-terminal domain-containing protein [Gammaproteobacteria bacterium]|nr:pre-peptidase C-terminal domain-containing protein [Gammaproteobacteria bacterium]